MKAVKSQIVYNGIELEVYQLPSGEYQLSKTQVGLAIEKDHKSLGRFLEGNSPEALPFKDLKLNISTIDGNNASFHLIPLNVAYSYWMYHARRGDLKAQNLITTLGQLNYDNGVKLFGDNFKQHVIFSFKSKFNFTKPEKKIQLEINEELKGLLEVSTPVGKIDILTDTLLIEVKKAKDWKDAIGQLLMYGHYYPKHQKVFYLFDATKNFDLKLVSHLCSDFNITVLTSTKNIKTLLKSTEIDKISLGQGQ